MDERVNNEVGLLGPILVESANIFACCVGAICDMGMPTCTNIQAFHGYAIIWAQLYGLNRSELPGSMLFGGIYSGGHVG